MNFRDKKILSILWILTFGLLIRFVPKSKIRHGVLAFLFKQVVTWLLGLIVVEKGWIEYPARLFKKSNRSSFSFEYFFFPGFCAIFNLHYPEDKGKVYKVLYYIFFSGIITGVEVLAEKYTDLIRYIKWKWYWSFLSIGGTFYLSHLFYRWFFKEDFENKEVTPRNS